MENQASVVPDMVEHVGGIVSGTVNSHKEVVDFDLVLRVRLVPIHQQPIGQIAHLQVGASNRENLQSNLCAATRNFLNHDREFSFLALLLQLLHGWGWTCACCSLGLGRHRGFCCPRSRRGARGGGSDRGSGGSSSISRASGSWARRWSGFGLLGGECSLLGSLCLSSCRLGSLRCLGGLLLLLFLLALHL